MSKPKLHTDALERNYGPIHAVILRHDAEIPAGSNHERIREVKLVDRNGIMKTYALTILADHGANEELSMIDREIRDGGLIGKTFMRHGYTITRNVIDAFPVTLSDWMRKEFHTTGARAQAKIIESWVVKDGEKLTLYGTILEVYGPDSKMIDDDNNTEQTLSEISMDSSVLKTLREKMIGYFESAGKKGT